MNQKEVFAKLRALGLKPRRCSGSSFRVAYSGPGSDESAYYTTSLADLLRTGKAMAARSPDERLLKMRSPSTLTH